MNDRLIALYLNNHLAGSVAGTELARRCYEGSRGTPMGDFMHQLITHLEEEQALVKKLLERLGIQQQTVKKLGAWFFEKMGEIAIGEYARKHPPLAQLFEIEGILLGSTARQGLWRLMELCCAQDAKVNFIDFRYYRERAELHCRELERYRQLAGQHIFLAD